MTVRELATLQETVRAISAELTQLAGMDDAQVTAHACQMHATASHISFPFYCMFTLCIL